jgi:hypothetical protein
MLVVYCPTNVFFEYFVFILSYNFSCFVYHHIHHATYALYNSFADLSTSHCTMNQYNQQLCCTHQAVSSDRYGYNNWIEFGPIQWTNCFQHWFTPLPRRSHMKHRTQNQVNKRYAPGYGHIQNFIYIPNWFTNRTLALSIYTSLTEIKAGNCITPHRISINTICHSYRLFNLWGNSFRPLIVQIW